MPRDVIPLPAFVSGTAPRLARLPFLLATFAVLAGVALRIMLYLRDPSVWHDEAALLVNVIDKTFAQLSGPLEFAEAAPPLFMWLERAVVVSIGSDTFAVRLPVLLAGCATVLVMVPLARRILAPRAVPLALAVVALSQKLLAHSVEAKPYVIDALCAAALAWMFLRSRMWKPVTRLLTFAALAPWLLWLSYPAVFGVGGIVLALLIDERPHWNDRLACAAGLLIVTTFVAFAALVAGPVRAQHAAPLWQIWRAALPDYARWWTVPGWLIRETIGIADYGFRPLGGLLLVAAFVGVRAIWRRDRALAIAFGAPWGLAVVAALAGQYPYAGSRVLVFTLPALAICSAEGADVFVTMYGTAVRRLTRVAVGAAVAGALFLAARDAVDGGDRPDAAKAARFVLSRLAPGDAWEAPYWEYRYYLRSPGSSVDRTSSAPNSGRLWVIIHGSSLADRERLLQSLYRRAGASLERHDFNRVSVYVVQGG